MSQIKKGTGIQSLEVGLSIVDLLAKHGQPMKFTEIQDSTKITKSNLYKYLSTLTQLGILYRDKKSGSYMLGNKLIEYGMAAVNQDNVVDRITPHLQEINERSQETVLFIVWALHGPMVIKKINSKKIINIGAEIGTYLPILSASGKIFAAFKDEREIYGWKEKEIALFSDQRKASLEKELQEVRRQRISFAREPLVPSVSSAAIPVFTYNDRLLGCVTIVGFSENIPQSVDDELSIYLIEKCKEISRDFGGV
ncbi:IclR family transcriptional regulator [Bacillaceae bacterium]